jgi:hypothetical protein
VPASAFTISVVSKDFSIGSGWPSGWYGTADRQQTFVELSR